MKKTLLILLALIMMVAFVAGCTKTVAKDDTKEVAETKKTEEKKQEPNTTDTPEVFSVNLDSLVPVTDELISMTMAVTVGAMNEEPEDMWFFKYFEELTNIHWDFTVIQSESWNEKKPIMMATEEYPDVFFGQKFTAGEIMEYGYEGIFLPLNDYIDTYGDMIIDKMHMVDGSWINITCPDGNIYGLPRLTLAYPFTDNRSWINQAWLDNLSLEKPSTLDEFYDVLVAFKEKDANNNGDATDEIPWSGHTGKSLRMMVLNAFGFATKGDPVNNIALDKNRDAVYMPLTDTYKDYLIFMNKCFEEGKVLDQDYFSQDEVQFKAKGAEGIIGAAQEGAPFLMDPDGFKDWIALTLTVNESDKPLIYKSSLTDIGRYIVTKTCEYPEAAVRWANLFYDPEYAYYIMYGPEYGTDQDPDGIGITQKFDDDGNWIGLDTPGWDSEEMGLWDYYAMNHPINSNFNFGIDDGYIYDQKFKGRAKNIDELIAKHKKEIDEQEGNLNEAYWRYQNLVTAYPYATQGYPTVYFSESAQDTVNELKVPLEDAVKSWEAKFITGAASITDDYDEFLAELSILRAEEYQQLYIDVYNKY